MFITNLILYEKNIVDAYVDAWSSLSTNFWLKLKMKLDDHLKKYEKAELNKK